MPENQQTQHARAPYFLVAFAACLIFIAGASIYLLPHVIEGGDAESYVHAAKVYDGTVIPQVDLVSEDVTLGTVTVHRMLTTVLSVQALRIFSSVFDSYVIGWLVWDTVVFLAVSVLFFILLQRIFLSHAVAFIGGLFFAGNYAMVSQGLGLFMDIGGWFFFVLSMFCLYAYMESGRYRDLFLTALAISVGAFFKENALFASIPLTVVLLYENYPSAWRFLKKIVPLGLLITVPIAVHHVQIYLEYGYTYIYWTQLTPPYYPSRILEYVKSIGSLLTLLAPLAALGAYWAIRWPEDVGLDIKRRVFIVSVMLGGLPALIWPGITQRVLFMIVPGIVMLACVFVRRFQHYWWAFFPIAILYILASFLMDSVILNAVNLPF